MKILKGLQEIHDENDQEGRADGELDDVDVGEIAEGGYMRNKKMDIKKRQRDATKDRLK